MSRKSLTAEYDPYASVVQLYFGESRITEWVVPYGEREDIEQRAWRRDQFVAERLREIFEHRCEE